MDKYYALYEAKLNNVKKIIEKLDGIFNVSSLKKETEKIEEAANEIDDAKREQDDSCYSMYIDNLNKILHNINFDYLPFYEIHLLTRNLENLTISMDENNYDNYKVEVTKLVDKLISVGSCKKEDRKAVIKKAYEILYKAILQEKTIGRREILDYIKNKRDELLEENLGLLVKEDISKLDPNEIVNIELKNLDNGLDYSYLNNEVISKVVSVVSAEENKAYEERKNSATAELLNSLDKIKREKEELNSDINENKWKIKNLKVNMALSATKVLACILVPISILAGSLVLGGKILRRADYKRKEYKTTNPSDVNTTEGFNLVSPRDEKYSIYVKVYSPWEKHGEKYERTYKTYSYSANELPEKIDADEIIKSVSSATVDKETKKELEEGDSTTEPEIIIVEYDRDMENSHLSILMSAMALLIAFLLIVGIGAMIDEVFDFDFIENIPEGCNDFLNDAEELIDLKKAKITRREIKERKELIGDKVVTFQEEYRSIIGKYGDLVKAIPQEQFEEVKKYIKVK